MEGDKISIEFVMLRKDHLGKTMDKLLELNNLSILGFDDLLQNPELLHDGLLR